MASEIGRGQTMDSNICGVRTAHGMQRTSGIAWEGNPERVRDPYTKFEAASWIQSTAGHVKPGGKTGGPPSKPKYYPVTDSV